MGKNFKHYVSLICEVFIFKFRGNGKSHSHATLETALEPQPAGKRGHFDEESGNWIENSYQRGRDGDGINLPKSLPSSEEPF
jgi:hypothetical protein